MSFETTLGVPASITPVRGLPTNTITLMTPSTGNFFFPDTASVHTHPANSAANPSIFESALQSGKKILNESDNVWTVNPDNFESDDVAKSCPGSYGTLNQYGGTTCRPSLSRVNADTIGCGQGNSL